VGEWVRFPPSFSAAWLLSLGVALAAAVAGFGLRKLGQWLVRQEVGGSGSASNAPG
jgi:hypothetical protein